MNIISADQGLVPQIPQAPRPQRQENLADVFGITSALQMVRRRFVLMCAVGAVVASMVLVFNMTRTPKYHATALVAINLRQERVLEGDDVLAPLPRDNQAINSEIEILQSPALTGRLVDSLDLADDPEFNWLLREKPAWRDWIGSLSRTVFSSASQQAEPFEAGDPVPDWLREALAELVLDRLDIRRRGLTYVIEIGGISEDPVRSQELANTYADIYLASQAEERVETAQRATGWLSSRVQELREDVQRKEAAVQRFREETGLMSAAGTSLTEQQITNVQTSVLQAQADLAEREARFRQLRDLRRTGGSLDTIADALNSDSIRALRDREAEIAREQSDLENRYHATHPAVRAIRAQRADINDQIEEEIARISVNLGNEVDVARSRLSTLEASLASITSELQAENAQNIQLRELEREAEASRQLYESYLERLGEIEGSAPATDVRLVSYARQPGIQVSPNLRIAVALAILIGGFIALIAGVIAEFLDRSIHSREEVEEKLGYPAVASVPTIRNSAMRAMPFEARNPPGYLVERPMSAFTESLRVLRTAIVHSRLGATSRVAAVASALPAEGKTSVALSLARVSALSGQKVIVVDCDLRKKSVSSYLQEQPEIGILEVLDGQASLSEAIYRDSLTQADVLPVAAASPFTPLDVFGSPAMEALMAELRANYELVVLDCPPLFAVAEARVIAALADTTVVVARMGKTTIDAVRVAIDDVVGSGGDVAGVVLNRVPVDGFARLANPDAAYTYELRAYYNTK